MVGPCHPPAVDFAVWGKPWALGVKGVCGGAKAKQTLTMYPAPRHTWHGPGAGERARAAPAARPPPSPPVASPVRLVRPLPRCARYRGSTFRVRRTGSLSFLG